MLLLRNREIKQFLFLMLAISAVGVVAGFFVAPAAGLLALALCIIFCAAFFAFLSRRYRQIAHISEKIDVVLHGDALFDVDIREGELSILQSELQKMTLRLREQADSLTRERAYLADSLADIAHQLRTPLTTVNMITTFLAEPGLDSKRRIELTQELRTLLSRVDWLLTSLLKISKIEAGTAVFAPGAVPAGRLVADAASPLLVPLELREVALDITGDVDAVLSVDAGWTMEALANLVKNSMEHTPAGGHITVDIAQNPIHTTIAVQDDGRGIDPEDLPHIFERFYRGRNAGAGSYGVGLALCRMIVTRQGGTIKAENLPGGGARFTIRFYHRNI